VWRLGCRISNLKDFKQVGSIKKTFMGQTCLVSSVIRRAQRPRSRPVGLWASSGDAMSAASLLCCLIGGGSRKVEGRSAEVKRPCKALIVHPLFVKSLHLPPMEFCPMDWLPDEVITNVLVHLVRF